MAEEPSSAAADLAPAKRFVGHAVPLTEAHVRVLDGVADVGAKGGPWPGPDRVADNVAGAAPRVARNSLETGAATSWLWHEPKGTRVAAGLVRPRPARSPGDLHI